MTLGSDATTVHPRTGQHTTAEGREDYESSEVFLRGEGHLLSWQWRVGVARSIEPIKVLHTLSVVVSEWCSGLKEEVRRGRGR